MKRLSTLLLLSLCVAGLAAAQQAPRRVILFIGDGVGTAYWTAARFAADSLAVERFRVMGLVDTRSSDSDVTDSGAGATAYSAGLRTFNGAIGVGPDSAGVRTVLEAARDRGWATGLVATSSVTHATPASFAAHVPSRTLEFEIAKQMLDTRVDVMLGGGRRWFDPAIRPDSTDLLGRVRQEYTYITDADGLRAAGQRSTRRLVGLFADNQMPGAATRSPTLPEMTRAALAVLERNAAGFFLMVEASQPDWRGHENAPLDAVTAEMLDFDRAIGVALDYQRRNPATLILVVADHETGGLALEVARDSIALAGAAQGLMNALGPFTRARTLLPEDEHPAMDILAREMRDAAARLRGEAFRRGSATSLVARYTGPNHTAALVPLFASGPGSERFAGLIDNWRVGRLLMEVVARPAR